MAVGACCVAAPLYTGEIAHQSIRGALGSLYQLMAVTGIFVAYLLGECLTPLQVKKNLKQNSNWTILIVFGL